MCNRKMAATFRNALSDGQMKLVALYRTPKAYHNEQRDDKTSYCN